MYREMTIMISRRRLCLGVAVNSCRTAESRESDLQAMQADVHIQSPCDHFVHETEVNRTLQDLNHLPVLRDKTVLSIVHRSHGSSSQNPTRELNKNHTMICYSGLRYAVTYSALL